MEKLQKRVKAFTPTPWHQARALLPAKNAHIIHVARMDNENGAGRTQSSEVFRIAYCISLSVELGLYHANQIKILCHILVRDRASDDVFQSFVVIDKIFESGSVCSRPDRSSTVWQRRVR